MGEGGGEGITASAAPTITTQYGPRPDGEFTTATLFVKTLNSAGGNTVAYYHHDHLGTPIQATDRSGIVVWSAQYNAYGKVNITTATEDKTVIKFGNTLFGTTWASNVWYHIVSYNNIYYFD